MTRIERNKKYARMLLKLFGPRGAHWIKGYWGARKHRGKIESLRAKHKRANVWCLDGACYKLGFNSKWLDREIRAHTKFLGIFKFNDHDGFPPVKALLQRIARTGTAKGIQLDR